MFSSQRVMQAATPKQKLKPEEDDNCYSRDRAPRMARQAKQQGSEHILARQTMSSPTATQKFGPKPRESKTIQSIQHNDSCKQGRNDKSFRCADPQASKKFESTVSSENQCAETTTRRYRNSASISEMSKQPSRQCNGQELSIKEEASEFKPARKHCGHPAHPAAVDRSSEGANMQSQASSLHGPSRTLDVQGSGGERDELWGVCFASSFKVSRCQDCPARA